MSVHADPATHGHRFGAVVVTVDLVAGDCMIRAPQPCKGPVSTVERKTRLNTLDEIYAACHDSNLSSS